MRRRCIKLGDADVAVGAGAESMSRGGYLMPTLRWGQRMNDGGVVDMMVGALTDPFDTVHMGITAENIAANGKSRASSRTSSPSKATAARSTRSKKAISRTRSCRSS